MTARKLYGIFLITLGSVSFLASCISQLLWFWPRKAIQVDPAQVAYVTFTSASVYFESTDRALITDLAARCNSLSVRPYYYSPDAMVLGGSAISFSMKNGTHQAITFFSPQSIRFTGDGGLYVWWLVSGEFDLEPYREYGRTHELWDTWL